MKTVVRRPNKTKAVVCLGAAVAVLVGGASTFARWAADVNLIATNGGDGTTIQAGEWDFSNVQLELNNVVWYDSSPEITSGYVGNTDNAHWDDHSGNTARLTFGTPIPMPGSASNAATSVAPMAIPLLTADGESTRGIYDSELGLYAVVPGDQLTAVYCVDPSNLLDNATLVGEHLKVGIDATSLSYSPSGTFPDEDPFWRFEGWDGQYGSAGIVDVLTGRVKTVQDEHWDELLAPDDAGDCAGMPKIAVIIDYAYGEDDPYGSTDFAKMKEDYKAAHEEVSLGSCSYSSGGLTMTMEKVTENWCDSESGHWTSTTTAPGHGKSWNVGNATDSGFLIHGLTVTVTQQR
jgi:hypothetical protein